MLMMLGTGCAIAEDCRMRQHRPYPQHQFQLMLTMLVLGRAPPESKSG